MIRMSTFAELVTQNYGLSLYCINCDRWETVDLRGMVSAGRGDQELTRARFRCRDCGEVAEKQVRPPVPVLGGAVGYV